MSDDHFTLCTEAPCLAEHQLVTWRPPLLSKLHRLPVIRAKSISSWGEREIELSKVHTARGRFLADRKTGTLYHLTGECVTSAFMRVVL
ncbi:hypothetical protein UFOVP73_35 [uncultured Caudovirales phage]|uniref:Uncharacterized protein n=1 Tax=uncultured Caudovirales phage TaxID=2100421 RepID=A0A6J5L119_9CAUD|nr:hypothetical protein UFOVP73_35 [uncultured Caudovirales phage]CAB5195170.1 hypothetical protein UFOVP170_57 [uncultured Caudovirales phage]